MVVQLNTFHQLINNGFNNNLKLIFIQCILFFNDYNKCFYYSKHLSLNYILYIYTNKKKRKKKIYIYIFKNQ